MRTILLCGRLFDGVSSAPAESQALVIEGERIVHVGPIGALPPAGPEDRVVDYRGYLVMPGLSDVHTHLSYGNARTEEEVDHYLRRVEAERQSQTMLTDQEADEARVRARDIV